MEIANTAAEIQRNMAIQKGIDPKEQWWEGLNRIEFHLANLAGGALYGGLHEATSIKPNTEQPGVVTAETPHVPGKITKTAPEPETVLSGHQTGPEYRPNIVAHQQAQTEPGTRAAPFEENGEAVNVPQGEQPATTSAPIEQTPQRTPARQEAEPNVPVAQTPERGIPQEEPKQAPQSVPGQPTQGSPHWEDLSPQERANQTAQARTGFLQAYQRFKPFFDALGVEMMENPYAEAAISTDSEGNSQLWFGPEQLAGMFTEYQKKGSEVPSFNTILQHELIHAAWINVERQRWAASGKTEDFNTFRRREAAAVTSDMHNPLSWTDPCFSCRL